MKDLARILVEAGDGGDGKVSFRHEKFAPKGGPDGGDGGKGGDVIIVADENIENLIEFNYEKRFEAKAGGPGRPKKMHGKDADDKVVRVPVGTEVYEIEEEISEINLRERANLDRVMKERKLVVDMDKHGKSYVVAYGGKGGRGNDHFKSSTNQTPMEAEEGKGGEKKWLLLEQKVVADVGIVGLPNVGKSSLLKALTRANPKIAGYPFTTLEPNLGVVKTQDKAIILVDVPGVVEEAWEGKGIGPWFMRHLERTQILIHVLAPNIEILNIISETNSKQIAEQLSKDYEVVRRELEKYASAGSAQDGQGLDEKPEIVVVNKMELVDEGEREKMGKEIEKKIGKSIIWVSAGMGRGLDELVKNLG